MSSLIDTAYPSTPGISRGFCFRPMSASLSGAGLRQALPDFRRGRSVNDATTNIEELLPVDPKEIPRLIVVCGVPGAGKSTLALHAIGRWGAVSFASENFADELGAEARTFSGDLTKAAITHAYSAMGAAVTAALKSNKLVLAVGSFRAEHQRTSFRDIATSRGASVTALRIVCPTALASKRVRLRIAEGERGPTERVIRQIDAELNRAADIDVTLRNDTSIEAFHRCIDVLIEPLIGCA